MGRGLESKESVSEMAGSAARGARHAARQNQDVGVEGRGPLLLSGYKEGRPYTTCTQMVRRRCRARRQLGWSCWTDRAWRGTLVRRVPL